MSNSSIPEEIQEEILSRLPVKSLLRFKSVCKSWYSCIRSPKFIKDHLNLLTNTKIMIRVIDPPKLGFDVCDLFYSIDYASISSATSCKCDGAVLMDFPNNNKVRNFYSYIVGSCNGLLLLDNNSTLFLWNPSTREYKGIIEPPVENPPSYGFGYDAKIDDYKLVCIAPDEVHGFSEVYVCTLESAGSWRRCQNIPYVYFEEGAGLLLNGALHWLCKAVHWSGGTATRETTIISFDISSEKFMDFPIPKEIMTFPRKIYYIQVLGDSLCLLCTVFRVCADVWVMQNYGVRESWTKQFTTTQERITGDSSLFKFYRSVKSGEILIQTGKNFGLYEQKNDGVRYLHINGINDINGIDDLYFCSESYVESLVSLNSGTYLGGKITNKTMMKFKKMKVIE